MAVGSCITMVAIGACGGDDVAAPGTGTATRTDTAPELAPSQTTPDTVAAPGLPPPCDPAQLDHTAGTPLVDGGLTIRIDNRGAQRCEAGYGESPIIGDDMEPDVWLEPGGAGEMAVAVDVTSCDDPAPIDTIGLVMNGEPVAVAVDRFEACTLALTALYPVLP